MKAEVQIQYFGDIHILIYMSKYDNDMYKLQDYFNQYLSEFLQTDRMVAVLQYIHYNMEPMYHAITNLLSFVFEKILSDMKEDFQLICTYIGFWIIPDEAAIQVILLFFW